MNAELAKTAEKTFLSDLRVLRGFFLCGDARGAAGVGDVAAVQDLV